ncbi:hypothetical protein [Wenyingzhuangia sp.]|jgi:hypothetical protein|uniref:hypothetical protein n=1 Tax=Wenyingzhuangia sp. TaxID=1964193 RepID=UPI003218F571
MERIKRKFVIGFLFSVVAIFVNIMIKGYNHLEIIASELGFNFIVFFLIGYVILGNIFGNKKIV